MDELAADRDLDGRLRGSGSEGPRYLDELRQRLRLADVARPLATDELGRVLERLPGR